MVKVKIRIIGVLVILLMLGTSPLSVNAFAENKVNQEENREILTEKWLMESSKSTIMPYLMIL